MRLIFHNRKMLTCEHQFAEARQAAGLDEHETLSHRTEEFGDIESQLWVDKYAPSSFTELLSDEVHQFTIFSNSIHIQSFPSESQ